MFPPLSTKDKNIEYHKQWCRSILVSSITDSWSARYRITNECYKFFNAGSSGEVTGFLQKAQDNTDLPAIWITMTSLRSKIEALVGLMEARGYDINVKALNSEATSRKLEERDRLKVERKLQPVANFAQAQTGLPVQQEKNIPQTDAELDERMETFKDKAEIFMEEICLLVVN